MANLAGQVCPAGHSWLTDGHTLSADDLGLYYFMVLCHRQILAKWSLGVDNDLRRDNRICSRLCDLFAFGGLASRPVTIFYTAAIMRLMGQED